MIDKNETVYVYDTDDNSLLGSWTAGGLDKPQGIATDGTDLWIVDEELDRVFRYAGATSRLTGSQSPSDSFPLDAETFTYADDPARRGTCRSSRPYDRGTCTRTLGRRSSVCRGTLCPA